MDDVYGQCIHYHPLTNVLLPFFQSQNDYPNMESIKVDSIINIGVNIGMDKSPWFATMERILKRKITTIVVDCSIIITLGKYWKNFNESRKLPLWNLFYFFHTFSCLLCIGSHLGAFPFMLEKPKFPLKEIQRIVFRGVSLLINVLYA
jgi:hypothetical protein